ncbi:MAG: flagellar basal body rod protein FlgC [Myxococcota bacterium]|jgi:flagellar basal-body rod protein FlgC|nr:flagellar basal body rod protein FlgC [Myxococcota bacterium]
MDLVGLLQISASGLSAQQLRLEVISANLANASATRSTGGGPYIRKEPVFQSTDIPNAAGAFRDQLSKHMQQVTVTDVQNDASGPRRVYDPGHPDADPTGYVLMPNVDVMREMVDLINASRSYEANVSALTTTRSMLLKALEIGR